MLPMIDLGYYYQHYTYIIILVR